jgi:hypothetical protein
MLLQTAKKRGFDLPQGYEEGSSRGADKTSAKLPRFFHWQTQNQSGRNVAGFGRVWQCFWTRQDPALRRGIDPGAPGLEQRSQFSERSMNG